MTLLYKYYIVKPPTINQSTDLAVHGADNGNSSLT